MPREVVFDPFGEKSRGLGVSGEAIQPSEVLERFGVGGNAETLIQAVREHNPPEIQGASAKRPHARLDELAKKHLADPDENEFPQGVNLQEIVGEGAVIHDVGVRGTGSVVYVAADGLGVLYKGTFELSDPEGTHVSQAEVLSRETSASSQIIGPRRMARSANLEAEQAALDARERAIARREQALAEAEREQMERLASSDDEGQKAERPAALPEDYDSLDVAAAKNAIANLPDPQDRAAALEYERQTKNRSTVLKLEDEGGAGGVQGGQPPNTGAGPTEST
jgi:hypothetical protein